MQTPIDRFSRHSCFLPVLMLLLAVVVALPAAPVEAADVISGAQSAITVELNRGSVLTLRQPADTVFVADPDICDIQMKSPRIIYLMGRKPGNTTLFAVDANDRVIANVDISVTHNLSRLKEAVRALHPDVSVRASSVDGALVLEGSVDSPVVAENIRELAAAITGKEGRVINRMGVAQPTQVNLRVKIAEISRDVEKALGINWTAVGEVFGLDFAFSFLNPFAASTNSIGLASRTSKLNINAVLDALETEGLISVLAQPNLTALSGETASFLAGGEFPILVPDDDKITIEFKKFGVSLAFTPTILDQGRINLHVRPEVSRLTNEGAVNFPIGLNSVVTVPALSVRRAETTVEVGSGQSFAIAGLLDNSSVHDVDKVPGLADVPVLGRLFTSDRFRRRESELVIIVTPYLVRPSSDRLPAPTDGFTPPSDLQRLYPSGTWRQAEEAGPPSRVGLDGSRLRGPVGFVLE